MKHKWLEYVPEKLKLAENWALFFKRIVYILCFAWLCYLDHIIGSATGSIQYGLKNYTGVVMAIIILTAYQLKDFIKIPYLVWIIVFFAGKHFAVNWAVSDFDNLMEFKSYMWNVGVYGIVIIRMLYGFILEKKKPRMNWSLFAFWLVMMVEMIVIRPDIAWSRMFLLFFGLFYLTDFSKKDQDNLFAGMVEGIILGFVLIQGYGLMHRPYDELRYKGMFSNTNINALFYAFCYCAVLCKWYQMKLKRRPIILRAPVIVLAGIIVGMTVLTMGRTALITMVLVTMLFLLFQVLFRRKWYMKIVEFFVDSVALLLAFVLCFVPVYNMVRYIPAYVDDPVYFESDVQVRDAGLKIEQGDPIDSEKYISFETVIEEAFQRILWFDDSEIKDLINPELLDWLTGFTLVAEAAKKEDDSWTVKGDVYVEPGTDAEHPILSPEEYNGDPVKLRMGIYKYYFKHLNPLGQRSGLSKVWITNDYSAPHAHNLLLHISAEFGWIIGLMFIAVIVLLYYTMFRGMKERKSGEGYFQLFAMGGFALILVAFGMLEINWIYGEIPFTMFFVVQYLMYHQNGKHDESRKRLDVEKNVKKQVEERVQMW